MNKDEKQEASIPVQSRIPIMDLANLAILLGSKGYHIRTMSQLVSWSIELLVSELSNNNLFDNKIETIADAHTYLTERGLYQLSLKRRTDKKISMAMGFEALRAEGGDPRVHNSKAYNAMHPTNQVQTLPNTSSGLRPFGDAGPEYVPVPDYCELIYKKGDRQDLERVLRGAKEAGIKSDSQKNAESIAAMGDSVVRGIE